MVYIDNNNYNREDLEMKITVDKRYVGMCIERAKKVAKGSAGRKDLYSKGRLSQAQRVRNDTSAFIAECAVALALGLKPEDALLWTGERDEGYDIKLGDGSTIDVKSTDNPYSKRLIYPLKKILNPETAADMFVMCVVGRPKKPQNAREVEIIGCVTTEDFKSYSFTASGLKGIMDGSKYMHFRDLQPITNIKI